MTKKSDNKVSQVPEALIPFMHIMFMISKKALKIGALIDPYMFTWDGHNLHSNFFNFKTLCKWLDNPISDLHTTLYTNNQIKINLKQVDEQTKSIRIDFSFQSSFHEYSLNCTFDEFGKMNDKRTNMPKVFAYDASEGMKNLNARQAAIRNRDVIDTIQGFLISQAAGLTKNIKVLRPESDKVTEEEMNYYNDIEMGSLLGNEYKG